MNKDDMFAMQYILPEGYPSTDGALDKSIVALTSKMKVSGTKDTPVPSSALSVRMEVRLNGTILDIKKRGQPVYLNFFCFEETYTDSVLVLVEEMYRRLGLGTAKRPKMPTWIHSVPVNVSILRPNEVILCKKVTVSFFWAVFAQHLKRVGAM
jgi:hypothetical protein